MSWLTDMVGKAKSLVPWGNGRREAGGDELNAGIGGAAEMAAPPAFRLSQPTFSQRWGAGEPAEDPATFEGFRPVGQIRQPASPPTVERITQKLLATKTDMEARKAQIEQAMGMPLVIENMEAKRRREAEAERQLAEYQAKLAEAPPMLTQSTSATLPEGLAGLGAALFGVRGDKAAQGAVALGDRRRQITDANARSQWEARQKAAGVGMDLSQARIARAGQEAKGYEELAQRIRQAAVGQVLGEEEWQKNRIAKLEDIETEQNWQKNLREWDRLTALEKIRFADEVETDSKKNLAMFENNVIAPLMQRREIQGKAILESLGALVKNQDPASVAELVRGLSMQGIDVPPGWQSLFMGIAVANRDDETFRRQMAQSQADRDARLLGLQVGRFNLDQAQFGLEQQKFQLDAMGDGVQFDGKGNPIPLQGGLLPPVPGQGGYAPIPVGPPVPVVTKDDEGGVRINLEMGDLPAFKGDATGQMLQAAQDWYEAVDEFDRAQQEVIRFRDETKSNDVPERLRKAEADASAKVKNLAVKHRTALAKAKGEKNPQFWNWVEAFRKRALEGISALAKSDLSAAEKQKLQTQIRDKFSRETGVTLGDVPGKPVK